MTDSNPKSRMTLNCEFAIGDRVFITDNEDTPGRVTALMLEGGQFGHMQYRVAWFTNGERHEEFMFPIEISAKPKGGAR